MSRIFFDTEFTGLHKDTTLISIGLISDCGKTFYAELIDYDKSQVDNWLQDNVINKLYLDKLGCWGTMNDTLFKGDKKDLKAELELWLSQFDKVKIWSDCLSYDWVLFNDIFGHAFNIPKNVYYIPFDICTLFKMKEIDADISREEFAEARDSIRKHTALYDAEIIRDCYSKLMMIGE